MADISLVTGTAGERIEAVSGLADRAAARATVRPEPRQATERPSDRVDISDRARLLSKLASLPEIRADLVDRVRREIADGTYETADRLDQAIQNLAEDLDIPN